MLLILAVTCAFVVVIGSLVLAFVLGARWITGLIQNMVQTQNENTVVLVERISGVLRDSVMESVKGTTSTMMASILGEPGKSVQQPEVGPDGDIFAPDWMKWEDGTGDEVEAGVGDSVFFQRPGSMDERVAMMEEGDQIVPGVPLPDMSGEEWQPT